MAEAQTGVRPYRPELSPYNVTSHNVYYVKSRGFFPETRVVVRPHAAGNVPLIVKPTSALSISCRAAPLVADREAKLQRLQKCSSWGAVYFALSSDDDRHIVRDVKGMTP
jgi:hypothetical protein